MRSRREVRAESKPRPETRAEIAGFDAYDGHTGVGCVRVGSCRTRRPSSRPPSPPVIHSFHLLFHRYRLHFVLTGENRRGDAPRRKEETRGAGISQMTESERISDNQINGNSLYHEILAVLTFKRGQVPERRRRSGANARTRQASFRECDATIATRSRRAALVRSSGSRTGARTRGGTFDSPWNLREGAKRGNEGPGPERENRSLERRN